MKFSAPFRAFALIAAASAICHAQTVPELLSTILGTTRYREASVSPNGRYVTWTVDLRNGDNASSGHTEIWLGDLTRPGMPAAPISANRTPHAEHGLAWAPDSRQFAFLSDADKPGQLQLYVQSADTSPRRITALTGLLAAPRWSPDGRRVAFLFTENAARAAGPLAPAAKPSGPVEEHIFEQRIMVADLRSGAQKVITPADTYVYECSWAPDSDRLAYTGAKGSGDNNWWLAQLYTVSADSGEVKEVHRPVLQIANPVWSPDGSRIAFIAGLMSDESNPGGDIYAIPAGGGAASNLTPGRRSTPKWIRWMPSGKIFFSETANGGTALASLDPATGIVETLSSGDETLNAGDDAVSASDDGRTLAAIRSSWTSPPEVWAGPSGGWTRQTRANDSLKPLWGRAENLTWQSDNLEIQGWLMYPLNYDPAKKYPLVVSVHGGPASSKRPDWPGTFDLTVLSSQGYFVFFPNPRGSYGRGEDFTRANVKDFGRGDLSDILLGIDRQLRTLPIDPNRLGIAGWSYGGYMTMWAITQTRRFHAAVAGAGIANWQSYDGQNLIDQWMIPYFGASVYDDPAMYARSSPMTFIRNVKTPTLLLVGDSDEECPAPQSYEYWHALRTLGVKTDLVVYASEGHSIRQPEHIRDILERTIAWFNANLATGK